MKSNEVGFRELVVLADGAKQGGSLCTASVVLEFWNAFNLHDLTGVWKICTELTFPLTHHHAALTPTSREQASRG